MNHSDTVIIGAGAAGLMCAISAGNRGRSVVLLDHANKAGKKILMSGGGHCNFTNLTIAPENYLSQNPHFHKSALSRYNQWDFIDWVERHKIAYHVKNDSELFCRNKSKEILSMLLQECQQAQVEIKLKCSIQTIEKKGERFHLQTTCGRFSCQSLVIACGGLSIPKMGATGFGYHMAQQFGHRIVSTTPALVPFTLNEEMRAEFSQLSGTSLFCTVGCNGMTFTGSMLLTHRGLSGPVILQISSYWQQGQSIEINLLPTVNAIEYWQDFPQKTLSWLLHQFFSRKLSELLLGLWFSAFIDLPLCEISKTNQQFIAKKLHHWQLKPNGTEGYRTAEVTKGGVDTNEVSSKTFESRKVKGLYFIGEVLDVTGHLGGYNFQWAWSSGFCAGQYV